MIENLTIDTPTLSKRDKQKQRTAESILHAAKKLFAELGYENTTTRAIATEAGVGIGTVFAHYPDKARLLGETLRGEIDILVAHTLNTLDRQAGLIDQLMHMSTGLLSYYIENKNVSRELIKNATFQEGPEALAYNEQMGGFVSVIRDIISDAVANGELERRVRAPAMSMNYLAIHFLIVMNCLRQKEPHLHDHIARMRDLVDALFDGYRKPPQK